MVHPNKIILHSQWMCVNEVFATILNVLKFSRESLALSFYNSKYQQIQHQIYQQLPVVLAKKVRS